MSIFPFPFLVPKNNPLNACGCVRFRTSVFSHTKCAVTVVCLNGSFFLTLYEFRPLACTSSKLTCEALHLTDVSEHSLDGGSALIKASPSTGQHREKYGGGDDDNDNNIIRLKE